MEWFRSAVLTVLVTLVSATIVTAGPVRAKSPSPATSTERFSMERIREAVHRPEVKEKLRARDITKEEVEHRLAVLESNLSRNQKRYLARQLIPADSPASRQQLPGSGGNQFLGTTLDLVTSIILLPIKIVAWFIPGL